MYVETMLLILPPYNIMEVEAVSAGTSAVTCCSAKQCFQRCAPPCPSPAAVATRNTTPARDHRHGG